jgi:hypothetical protein
MVIVFIIFVLIILVYLNKNAEHYTSAVIDQLYAKGPIDHYLTGGVDRYIPEFPGSPYRYLPYNVEPNIRYYPVKCNKKYNLGF